MQIIHGSKQFEFDGSVLIITSYYTGERLRLDLGNLDEEMLEALTPDDGDPFDEDEDSDDDCDC
jgi:hypothetical protein